MIVGFFEGSAWFGNPKPRYYHSKFRHEDGEQEGRRERSHEAYVVVCCHLRCREYGARRLILGEGGGELIAILAGFMQCVSGNVWGVTCLGCVHEEEEEEKEEEEGGGGGRGRGGGEEDEHAFLYHELSCYQD